MTAETHDIQDRATEFVGSIQRRVRASVFDTSVVIVHINDRRDHWHQSCPSRLRRCRPRPRRTG